MVIIRHTAEGFQGSFTYSCPMGTKLDGSTCTVAAVCPAMPGMMPPPASQCKKDLVCPMVMGTKTTMSSTPGTCYTNPTSVMYNGMSYALSMFDVAAGKPKPIR